MNIGVIIACIATGVSLVVVFLVVQGTALRKHSQEETYAKGHDAWVCRYCETINANALHTCAACGADRKTKRK